MVTMRFLSVVGLFVALLYGTGSPPSVRVQAQTASLQVPAPVASLTAEQGTAVLQRYCVRCHNERLVEAKVAPSRLDVVDLSRVGDHAELLEKVLSKLRAREMPPPLLPRPDEATYQALAAYLETELDRAGAVTPNPGRPTVRRFTRTEYANAIRDLLALEIDVNALLPAETQAYGFDNIGDVVSMSAALFQRYLSAARKISRLAVGDVTIVPNTDVYHVSRFLRQDGGRLADDDLPFGSRGGTVIRHHFPVDGEYTIRVTYNAAVEHAEQLDVRIDGARVALFQLATGRRRRGVGGRDREPWKEFAFAAKAGTRTLAVTFIKTTLAFEGVAPRRPPGIGEGSAVAAIKRASLIRVAVAGPHAVRGPGDTPSRQKVFVCLPTTGQDEETCASKILSPLARRAYRRPVSAADLQPLLDIYRTAREVGEEFEGGIQRAIAGLLVDPEFLFRIERDPEGRSSAYGLSDIELASRLSFFLWSSIPDEELLSLAERGTLSDVAVLEQQVRRMLADDRGDALVENFGAQWLHLRNLQQITPDFNRFPSFDDNLRDGFRRETELFLASQIREDRPVIELLNANYTFVNERLAQHYGIPNVYGAHFRRVTLTDPNRFGLLGHGSILTVTSYPNRTSPVVRGNWLLTTLLDSPPPPPPPADVPPLNEEEQTASGRALTVRERQEQHRKDPACSVCHTRMDPLGFALENFDAIGRWRARDAGIVIDPSGVLPDGTKLDGPVGLRQVFLDRREQFATTVTKRLLVYAIGRGVEYYDMPTIRKTVRESASTDYRWSSIIVGIVSSDPFQMRTRESQP